MRIGYFEAWNLDRPCANMDISKMTDGNIYSHVHWAFGNITESWEVDVSGLQEQFDGLKELKDIQRILSFGGWGFSTEPYTHNIFREGVKDGNRQILAANVAKFINDNDLDGVDFDWEYPGVSSSHFKSSGLDLADPRFRRKIFQVLGQTALIQAKTMPHSSSLFVRRWTKTGLCRWLFRRLTGISRALTH